jgi:hypothetical protein
MEQGLKKSLEDIAYQLKSINTVLSSLWYSKYEGTDTNVLDPRAYADEYISTEECARRLGVSDQTIRNWMAIGRKTPDKGWIEGVHYVNVTPDPKKKAVFRIPWNRLIQSFSSNRKAEPADYANTTYQTTVRGEPI